jgi:LacI family transcriptional regulator
MAEKLEYPKIKLNPNSPTPLYLQLADNLQELIRQHRGTECRLPSVRSLTDSIGCDRSTVSKAYLELQRQGIIERVTPYKFYVNNKARKLTNPFPNIGLIIPCKFSDYLNSSTEKFCLIQYITGIIDRAAEENISTMMLQLPAPNTSSEQIDEFLSKTAIRLDGIIHLGARYFHNDPPLQKLFNDIRIPQVMLSATSLKNDNVYSILSDVKPAVKKLCEILKVINFSKIAIMVWGSLEVNIQQFVTYEASFRCQEMLESFTQEGFNIQEEYIMKYCDSYHNVYNNLASLIRKKNLPEVICCQNDQIAIWCIQALERQNIRVPLDVSVIGCDNCAIQPWNENLTTIAMPFYELGKCAIDMIKKIQNNELQSKNMSKKIGATLKIGKTLLLDKNSSGDMK